MQSPYCEQLTLGRPRELQKLGKQGLQDATSQLRPLIPRQRRKSRAVRAKWLREAQALLEEGNFGNVLKEASVHRDAKMLSSFEELVERPVVALRAENEQQTLEYRCANTKPSDSLPKLSVVAKGNPLIHSKLQRHEKAFAAIRKRPRYPVGFYRCSPGRPLSIEPLMSREMLQRLQFHLEEKIKGDIWENEIRSRLARPLSATAFCARREQLYHHLSAPKFISPTTSEKDFIVHDGTATVRFPYSTEAHEFTRRIGRCYETYRFRIDVLERLRHVAIAIRVLRRRAIPAIIAGFRRRRRAAVKIQRRFRRYVRWRELVLRPFVTQKVSKWIVIGIRVARAKISIANWIMKVYLARRTKEEALRRRAAHLNRWKAKTRVCLFVHQVWAVQWLRQKRENNVAAMWLELQALEAIERSIHREYKVLFVTAFGKNLVNKELKMWRQTHVTPALSTDHEPAGDLPQGPNDHLVRLKQCFRVFDFDGSGTLDLDEFELLLAYLRGKPPRKPGRRMSEQQKRALPPRLTAAQVRNLFDDLDSDANGTVTYEELEKWWISHLTKSTTKSAPTLSSASSSYLSGGLERLLLHSHGLLFWLLGRKQQLEKKYVKKMIIKRAMNATKRVYVQDKLSEGAKLKGSGGTNNTASVYRCPKCARRFGLRRDLDEHTTTTNHDEMDDVVVDTFVMKRWVHEEEFRLLDE